MANDKRMGVPVSLTVALEDGKVAARADGFRLVSFSAEKSEAYAHDDAEGRLVWSLTSEHVADLLAQAPGLVLASEVVYDEDLPLTPEEEALLRQVAHSPPRESDYEAVARAISALPVETPSEGWQERIEAQVANAPAPGDESGGKGDPEG